ncbi:MAG: hypothetical protein AAB892_00360 [Patescibacteria group bacterium]
MNEDEIKTEGEVTEEAAPEATDEEVAAPAEDAATETGEAEAA